MVVICLREILLADSPFVIFFLSNLSFHYFKKLLCDHISKCMFCEVRIIVLVAGDTIYWNSYHILSILCGVFAPRSYNSSRR